MTNEDLKEIQDMLGYPFNIPMLLQQAFIRRSYSQEHKEHENNEVLEFIGDKVLDVVVVRHLAEQFGGYTNSREYASDYNEGKLTEFKKKLVSKTMLAHRIDILGFSRYLIMGKGDIINNVAEDDSVKEDLFEAILGAVALDANWNWERINIVVDNMLPIDDYLENGFDTDEENYVELIQEWCQKTDHELPIYSFNGGYYYFGSGNRYSCTLRLSDVRANNPFCGFAGLTFNGEGTSKLKAKMDAAEMAYRYLEENDMLYTMADMIDEPDVNKAINQLQELSAKGYIPMPEYEFSQKYNENGNPVWTCSCSIEGREYYYSETASSKKDAKKQAAYAMLLDVLGQSEDDEEDDDDYYDDDD